ncbi:hypothetical protein V2J09_013637 [Rumex salicifolius]
MWIAEGFVADDQEMRCEDKAMWFLSELAQRYIIQVIERNHQNQIESLRLHDLMREFCIKKATEYQFFEIVTSTDSHVERLPKARRLSISSRVNLPIIAIREGVNLMEVLGQLSKLKFLHLGHKVYLGTQLSFAGTAFPQLQELEFRKMFNLEEWIRLPERLRSITTLKELQIRIMPLEFCKRLKEMKMENQQSLLLFNLEEWILTSFNTSPQSNSTVSATN